MWTIFFCPKSQPYQWLWQEWSIMRNPNNFPCFQPSRQRSAFKCKTKTDRDSLLYRRDLYSWIPIFQVDNLRWKFIPWTILTTMFYINQAAQHTLHFYFIPYSLFHLILWFRLLFAPLLSIINNLRMGTQPVKFSHQHPAQHHMQWST